MDKKRSHQYSISFEKHIGLSEDIDKRIKNLGCTKTGFFIFLSKLATLTLDDTKLNPWEQELFKAINRRYFP